MNAPACRDQNGLCCEIVVKGQLDPHWADWFSGLQMEGRPGGQTALAGDLPDQSALRGVLDQLFNLNLQIVSLRVVEKPT